MNCGSAFERLSAAMDGELAPSEALAVEEHVRGCASCARAQSSLQATRIALRHLPAEAVSGGFDAAMRARLTNDATPRGGPKARVVALTSLAAALLVLAAWPGRRTGPERRTLPEGPTTTRSAGAAALDCGLTGSAVLCRIDAPCADAGQCGRPGPVDAPFTPSPVVEAW